MTFDPQSETLAGSAPPEPALEAAKTPEASKPPETVKAVRSPAEIRQVRERIVLLSMGLVTAATAASLYVVYEFSLGSAVLGASGVWAALMTVHLQLKKDSEIRRLKAELHRAERYAALANGFPYNSPAPPARGLAAKTGPSQPPLHAGPAPVELRQAPPPAVRRPADDDTAEEDAMSPDEPASTTLRLDPNPRWEAPSSANRGPAPSEPKVSQNRVAASARSSATKDKPKAAPPAPVVETALWPGTEISAADPMRDQWAFRPRQDVEASGFSAPPGGATQGGGKPASVEADLEMVQRKIKALADEVNAAEAERERQAVGVTDEAASQSDDGNGAPARSSMIERSIGALKSAASTMRGKSADDTPKRESGTAPSAIKPSPAPYMQGPPTAPSANQPLSLDLLIPKTAQTIATSAPQAGQRPQDVASMPEAAATRPLNPRVAAIAAALADGEMDVFLSPIVALQSHKVSHYDVTVRLKTRGGSYVDDAEDELRLEGSDLLALFDTARLKRAAAVAQKLEAHNKKGSLLSSVNGTSMTNLDFLDAFAQVFEDRNQISNQLVLTFAQADVEAFSPSAWQALDDMRAFGFSFALSKIDHADMDFSVLSDRGFAFIRLEAGAFLNGLPAGDRFMAPDELCRYLAGSGMTLVADTIDDEAVRARVFGFGILFGQGRLFGGARQIKLDPIPSGSSAAA